MPAWTSATRAPPPRSAAQSTASFIAIGYVLVGSPVAAGVEVAVVRRGGRLGLALVLRPELGEPYGRSTGLDILKKLICPIRIP